MAGKNLSDFIKTQKIDTPHDMEYGVVLPNSKKRDEFIKRIEKIIRASQEYRDYIAFLRESMDLNKCVFFQNISTGEGTKRSRIKIELHHETFTLYDYVSVVLDKALDSGESLNDLLIADEVLCLHYENLVGLIPLSKTAHETVHNSNKLTIPLNMCYGNYSEFLERYDKYIPEEMYEKLQRKIDMTRNLTPESFDAIKRQFTYVDVKGFENINKMEITSRQTA